jgi:hypothetical protein
MYVDGDRLASRFGALRVLSVRMSRPTLARKGPIEAERTVTRRVATRSNEKITNG